jgi:ribosomal protein S12 methylthiotransferase
MTSCCTRRFYVETLGCPKNRVDSEGLARALAQAGYTRTLAPAQADILIVNTCGFIESARQESISALRMLEERKLPGQLLVAAGCLSQRQGPALVDAVPGLDGVLGTRCWSNISQLVDRLDHPGQHPVVMCEPLDWRDGPLDHTPRVAVQGPTAYLKIADGCSASCAFCAIPAIKGPARSRPLTAILLDAEELVRRGVVEIIVIAQDTTSYGRDLGIQDGLSTLVERLLLRVPELHWLRLLYAYPQYISVSLIKSMVRNPQVCHYLDLPLQHAHPDVLRRMRRPDDMGAVRRLVGDLRSAMPDIALRTSFIVGYPGETDEEFRTLLDFVAEIQFDRVGVFTYSREESTPAAELEGQILGSVKSERYHQMMELQQRMSLARNQGVVGRTLDVLIEGCNEGVSVGRSYRDAPEIDGLVLVDDELPIGVMNRVRITGALEYDLIGVPVTNSPVHGNP